MSFRDPLKRIWHRQYRQATDRNIEWQLTFDEWLTWWQQQLGPDWLAKRGKGKGRYVMARFNDCGPYAIGNIKCELFEDNIRESALRRIGKLNSFFGRHHTTKSKLQISTTKRGVPRKTYGAAP